MAGGYDEVRCGFVMQDETLTKAYGFFVVDFDDDRKVEF